MSIHTLGSRATSDGAWRWDDLIGALDETLDLAAVRAVEPGHLDDTAYARFLPAFPYLATAWEGATQGHFRP